MNLRLRKADHEDMDLLYCWANDDTVRANAFHTEKIPYENHVRWFNNLMADTSAYQYILCADDTPVGQIRLNVEDSDALVDYSVSPDQRRKGYGSAMLRMVQEQIAADKIIHVTKIVGQVKYGNSASARAFEKCGFVKRELSEYIQYEKSINIT